MIVSMYMHKPGISKHVHAGDRRAALDAIVKISSKLNEIKANEGEAKVSEYLAVLKDNLGRLAKSDKSTAQALLDELENSYPDLDWTIKQ